MRIALTERFQKGFAGLRDPDRTALFDVMLALPKALGQPHLHTGLGLRKVHPSGIWEGRVGLGLRIVFGIEAATLTLVRAGTHAEVRRYLRTL